MHLVNWENVKKPVLESGMQIRDPTLSNLALGGKLLWQLVCNKKHPVSQIFKKTYLHTGSLKILNWIILEKDPLFGICAEVVLNFLINISIEFLVTKDKLICGRIKLLETLC